jgi:hypothetical protein
VDLEHALEQFDRTEANLQRLQQVLDRMRDLIPAGIVFPGTDPDEMLYAELSQAFNDIAAGLPAIDGEQLLAEPVPLSDIAQTRLDADEIDEPEILIRLGERLAAPTHAIATYRHRLSAARKRLVRKRAVEVMSEIDHLIAILPQRIERDGNSVADDTEWQRLHAAVKELDRLVGQDITRRGGWSGLFRHLGFAQGVDLHDIADHDWPSVRPDVEAALYGELEPLPIEVEDLGTLAAAQPEGAVTAELQWTALDDDKFERLIFNLLTGAAGYENPRWLMKTRAPDRGRDLSVDRVVQDALSGVKRHRVLVQCKHWLSRSLNVDDCSSSVTHVSLWEPPRVDVLVIATSGRFTSDAVRWVEQHNEAGKQPEIELWANSHLEMLLAPRGALVTELGLRSR